MNLLTSVATSVTRLFDRVGLHLVAAIVALFVSGSTGSAADGWLRVMIKDDRGKTIPARAWVDVGKSRLFEPVGPATCTPYNRDRSFSCDGWFVMRIPAGEATLHVERGKEWLPLDKVVSIDQGRTNSIAVTLKRWVNLADEGWYSADMHVHFGHDNPRVMSQLALADDVNIVPAFSLWLRGREKQWQKDWPPWGTDETIAVDNTHFLTRANLEIERIGRSAGPGGEVGATFIYQLGKPVSADRFDTRFPTDTTLALAAKQASTTCVIDTDKPSWAETVIGAALGVYDTAQVCHNHYHRDRTMPGGWGMIGELNATEKDLNVPDELFRRTNAQYYRWLNCGIRMGVSGGSAMGVMAVPLGYNRVYAKVEGELTPVKFWAAVKAGRTFATSGPMLTMTVNGHEAGSVIESSKAGSIQVRAQIRSIDQLSAVEIIQNGTVVFRDDLSRRVPRPPFAYQASLEIAVTRSGWFAARVLYRAPDGRLRQAHTSPVYVIANGKPIASKADAQYNIRWVDRLLAISDMPDRYRSGEDRLQVQKVYRQARAVYENVSRMAVEVWGD